MKKLILSCCGLLFSWAVFSQSFTIIDPSNHTDVTNGTVLVSFSESSLGFLPPDVHIYIKNKGSQQVWADMKRYELKPLVDSTSNYFCWGATCLGGSETGTQPIRYGATTDTTYIAAGDTNKTLSAYFDPSNFINGTFSEPNYQFGSQSFLYVVYNHNNPNDSASVTITFDITTGIQKISKSDYQLKLGPNPTNGLVNISYDLRKNYSSKSLQLFNILGTSVKTIKLNNNRSNLQLNISDLNSGIYFYNLLLDGKTTEPQKLIIAK